jgi:hypothetical protein
MVRTAFAYRRAALRLKMDRNFMDSAQAIEITEKDVAAEAPPAIAKSP